MSDIKPALPWACPYDKQKKRDAKIKNDRMTVQVQSQPVSFTGWLSSMFTVNLPTPGVNIDTNNRDGKTRRFLGDYNGDKTEEMIVTAIDFCREARSIGLPEEDWIRKFVACIEDDQRRIIERLFDEDTRDYSTRRVEKERAKLGGC